jgi:hypothetical protein
MTDLYGDTTHFFECEPQDLGECFRHEPLTPKLGMYFVEYLADQFGVGGIGKRGLFVYLTRTR